MSKKRASKGQKGPSIIDQNAWDALIRHFPDVIMKLDRHGTILFINRTLPEYTVEDVIGTNVTGYLSEPDGDRCMRELKEVFRSGEPRSLEMGAAGPTAWFARLIPVQKNGQVDSVMVLATEFTIQKQAEETLETQSLVLEKMVEGVNVTDSHGNLVFTNPAFDAMFGYERGELMGQPVSILNAYSAEENKRKVASIIDTVKSQGTWAGEFENRKKDGSILMTRVRISGLLMAGKTCWISVQEDITERNRSEQALRESETKNRLLIAAIPDMMFRMHRDGTYLEFIPGQGLEPVVSPGEFIGKKIGEVLPNEIAEPALEHVKRALESGSTQIFEYQLPGQGKNADFEARIIPQGEHEVLIMVRDISLRKRNEERERASRNLLAVINQAQSEFIIDVPPQRVFDRLLGDVIALTESKLGFIGRVLYRGGEAPDVETLAISNLSWSKETREFYNQYGARELDSSQLKFLFRSILADGAPVLSNLPAKKILGKDHSSDNLQIHQFLGLPLYKGKKLVGVVGVANRSGGYHEQTIEYLQPFLSMLANILEAYGMDLKRQEAEESLRTSESRFRSLIDQSPLSTQIFSPDGEAIQVNQAWEKLWSAKWDEVRPYNVLKDPQLKSLGLMPYIEEGFSGKPTAIPTVLYDPPLVGRKGTARYVRGFIYPVKDERGEVREVVIMHEDMTPRTLAERALDESEAKYRMIINNVDEIVYRTELKNGDTERMAFKFVSAQVEEILGYTPDEFIRDSGLWSRMVHPEEKEILSGSWEKMLRSKEKDVREYRLVHKTKREYHWMEDKVVPQFDAGGGITGFVGVARDISHRKRTEEVIRRSEEQYRNIVETAEEGIWIIDQTNKTTFVNKKIASMLGYTVAEMMGKDLFHFIAEEEKATARANVKKRRQGIQEQHDFRFQRKDGSALWAILSTSPLFDQKGNYEGALAMVTDITERKLTEERLEGSKEELRAFSARLQSIREEERTRIAREIHDELGQTLTGLKMDLVWIHKRVSEMAESDLFPARDDVARRKGGNRKPASPAKNKMGRLFDRFKMMNDLIDSTIGEVRRISTELRPGLLDDLGLVAAIEWQAQEFQSRTGIECKLSASKTEVNLDRDRVTTIFRIFQETLTNVVRHANASRVKVNLKKDGNAVVLTVQDNGSGIDPKKLTDTQSLGLIGMRERVYPFGGQVRIDGVPGTGTTVRVSIPLEEASDGSQE